VATKKCTNIYDLDKTLVQTPQELGKTISRNVMTSGVGAYVVDDFDS
jgi:hypothetical protein